jgi:hypothetical protein
MIESCVFRPFDGEEACTDVISIAEDNLENILKGNLEQLLEALEEKMNDDSVVIFNGYAQFVSDDGSHLPVWHPTNIEAVQHGKRGLRREAGLDAVQPPVKGRA